MMEQAVSYGQALLASVTINTIIPLVILVVMMLAIWRLIVFAQRKNDFHIERIFYDEAAKPHIANFLMALTFAMSCWYLAVDVLSGAKDVRAFYAFLAAFANSLTLLRLAERWDGRLPFAKGPAAE